MKKSNWLFMIMLILSTMITVSSNSWISMWIGLELNMMSFIPIILYKMNKSSSEAAMTYFLIQSISSMLMLMFIIVMMMNMKFMMNIITICMLIKMGAAPFHSWLPEILSKMSWMKCNTMMTWQKIAPLMMISNTSNNITIMNASIILSVIIGSMGGLNQVSLRKMMGYSSINHLGWMLAINKTMNLWTIYLLIYSVLMTFMCYKLMYYKLYFLNQINNLNMNNTEKISMFIMMLSLGGLPPLIGFLPKWIAIQSLINNQEYILLIIMIMSSLITLMFYMRIMTSMYLSFGSTIKWSKISKTKMFTFMMLSFNFLLPLIMIMDL
uniref:NADH dehydrogenase subunit 2 n=1 Tax=Hippotiscus dorsalis TaxID=2880909 RepID=UPI001D10BB6C|nr:NADH dehydrogenase subunit 2 [Hippotiscus dorsalis]UCC46013.1 NADH dehydrogenase subunit 2 [Hippotiscus dorsalis]